jgi:ABC-type Fe3+/spermidine/putrescine transport system ATPase subunit
MTIARRRPETSEHRDGVVPRAAGDPAPGAARHVPEEPPPMSAPPPAMLELERLGKWYGAVHAVRDLSLEVPRGAVLTLLGPSGCGKTTALRMIAGFANVDHGRIMVDGRDNTRLPPEARETGMVFQSYALFPHLTVAENIGFGLRMRRTDRRRARARVERMIDLVQLRNLEDRFPSQLSGGQQQRVALARALVIEPKLLLLDEPLAALDRNLRSEMQVELRRLQQRLGITTVMVTHDQEEALVLSDLVAVMNGGQIEQLGPPLEVYDRPRTEFVARFMGVPNLLPATVDSVDGGRCRVRLAAGPLIGATAADGIEVGRQVLIAIRPSRLAVGPDDNKGPSGVVTRRAVLGERIVYDVSLGGTALEVHAARTGGDADPGEGDRVGVVIDPAHAIVVVPP